LTILSCVDSLRAAYSGDARTLGNVEIDRGRLARGMSLFVREDASQRVRVTAVASISRTFADWGCTLATLIRVRE
jgi:hypothetical protein